VSEIRFGKRVYLVLKNGGANLEFRKSTQKLFDFLIHLVSVMEDGQMRDQLMFKLNEIEEILERIERKLPQ